MMVIALGAALTACGVDADDDGGGGGAGPTGDAGAPSCELPSSPAFRAACDPDGGVGPVSCALLGYAGCALQVCLIYRDDGPYCSQKCTADDECPATTPACLNLLSPDRPCQAAAGEPMPECYCTRR